MGILEVATIVFVVLKLLGVIAWSWWLVFSPLLLAVGMYLIFMIFFWSTFIGIIRSFRRD